MFHFRTNGRGGDSPVVMRVNEGAKAVSEYLASLGIPGIRYLDGNSRDGGSGTSNYVIFDENLVKIIEENGRRVDNAPFSLATRRSFLKGLASSILLSHQANAGESLNEAMKGVGTNLSPEEEVKFQAWKAKYAPMDSGSDYDLRGAFKEGITPDGERGHFPDTYKFPNHPTFSKESKYSTPEHPGGEWGERNGRTTFTPSEWMADDASRMEDLKKYFKKVEPDAELIMPGSGGKPVGAPFSLAPRSQQDTEYLAAVKAGDMETAQRMVDEAAKAAGYTRKAFHGTEDGGFTTFDPAQTSKQTGFVYASSGKGTAASYSGSRKELPAGSEGRGVWALYLKEPEWVLILKKLAGMALNLMAVLTNGIIWAALMALHEMLLMQA